MRSIMRTFRYLAEAALVYLLIALFRALPVHRASALGGWIGRNGAARLSTNRKAKRHITQSLHTSLPETDRIVTGMWDNLGRLFAEYPHLPTIYMERTEVIGIEHLGNLPTTPDTPAIFFSGHLANWEVSAPALRQHNIDVDLIYRPPNNPYVKTILDTCRSMGGTLRTYPKSAHGMRQVVAALKQGRRIGILIDQKYNQGVSVPFFGQPAMTSLAFIQLARKFNCPLIPIQIERRVGHPDGPRFRVTIHPPMDVSKDDTTLIHEAHTLLEGWITAHPEQWLWLHKRWVNTPKP